MSCSPWQTHEDARRGMTLAAPMPSLGSAPPQPRRAVFESQTGAIEALFQHGLHLASTRQPRQDVNAHL